MRFIRHIEPNESSDALIDMLVEHDIRYSIERWGRTHTAFLVNTEDEMVFIKALERHMHDDLFDRGDV